MISNSRRASASAGCDGGRLYTHEELDMLIGQPANSARYRTGILHGRAKGLQSRSSTRRGEVAAESNTAPAARQENHKEAPADRADLSADGTCAQGAVGISRREHRLFDGELLCRLSAPLRGQRLRGPITPSPASPHPSDASPASWRYRSTQSPNCSVIRWRPWSGCMGTTVKAICTGNLARNCPDDCAHDGDLEAPIA